MNKSDYKYQANQVSMCSPLLCICTMWTPPAWMPARISLALLVLMGMMNTVMVRVNLSVGIVAMVRRNLTSVTSVKAHCVTTTTHGKPTLVLQLLLLR